MDRINVTKTYLPPIEEYQHYLRQIWSSNQVTNQGPLLKKFEKETANFLKVDNFHFVANGTIALQIALRALDITDGEIITTPFSYVATTSAILWERCEPVYVDIDPETFCIDATKIEAAITDKTKAILAVHVFGHPCDIEKIDDIAKKHNLKVIYDGAHAFGANYNNRSLLAYGDISVGSFHATKPFHTIEGGCVIAADKKVSEKLELIKRFGHNGDTHYMLGINAKASEFQAAMGLCNLLHIESIIEARKSLSELYDQLLGADLRTDSWRGSTKYNYSYYPVVFGNEEQLTKAVTGLNKENIFPRRYFYPSLNKLPYIIDKHPCPVSEKVAASILCLPLYSDLAEKDVKRVCEIIKSI